MGEIKRKGFEQKETKVSLCVSDVVKGILLLSKVNTFSLFALSLLADLRSGVCACFLLLPNCFDSVFGVVLAEEDGREREL